MGTINPQLPVVGQPNTTEDPKIISAINTIADAINGELDNSNIADDADINGNKLLVGSVSGGPGGQIAYGTLVGGQLVDNTITATQIGTGEVGTAELASNAVTADKVATTTSSAIASASGYTGTATAYLHPTARLVTLEGTRVGGASVTAGAYVIGTVPSGYRPAVELDLPVLMMYATDAYPVIAKLKIATTGICTVEWSTVTMINPGISLSGITYRVAS
jgi:hypothetical protein